MSSYFLIIAFLLPVLPLGINNAIRGLFDHWSSSSPSRRGSSGQRLGIASLADRCTDFPDAHTWLLNAACKAGGRDPYPQTEILRLEQVKPQCD